MSGGHSGELNLGANGQHWLLEAMGHSTPTKKLRVLVACEYSGTVREAFAALGHDALSCDLLPTDRPGNHYQGDVRDVLDDGWDLMICHPPCTYLSVSGIHWNDRGRGWEETDKALDFVRLLMGANIPHIALENPVSIISSRIRKPDQIVQPHQFGHDASKATCLWLKNLPKLTPTQHVEPTYYCCGMPLDVESLGMRGCPNCEGDKLARPRWGNQTASGQNKLGPSDDRWKIRSTTYSGIAEAMANQWSKHVLSSLTNSRNASAAEENGAPSTTSTTLTANASDQAMQKTMGGPLKNEMESSTEYVLCPPGDVSVLMRALARR